MQRGESSDQWRRRGSDKQGGSGHRDRDDRHQNFHRNSRGWSYNRHQSNSRDRGPRRNIPYNNHKSTRYEDYSSSSNYQESPSPWLSSHPKSSNRDLYKSNYSPFEESGSRPSEDRDRQSPDRRNRHYSSDEDNRPGRSYHRRHSSERRRDNDRNLEDSSNLDKVLEPSSTCLSLESTPHSLQFSVPASTLSPNSKSEYENVVELANKITSLGPSLRDPRLIARVLKIKKQDTEISVSTSESSITLQVPDSVKSPVLVEERHMPQVDDKQRSTYDSLKVSREEKPPSRKKYTLVDPRLITHNKNTKNNSDVNIKPVFFKSERVHTKSSQLPSKKESDSSTLIETPTSPTKNQDSIEIFKEDLLKAKEVEESILNECKIIVAHLDELKMPSVKSLSRKATQGLEGPSQPTKETSSISSSREDNRGKDAHDVVKDSKKKDEIQTPKITIIPVVNKDGASNKQKQEGRAKMTTSSNPEKEQDQAIMQIAFSPRRNSADKLESGSQGRSTAPKQPGLKGILNKVMKTSISQVLRTNLSAKREATKSTSSTESGKDDAKKPNVQSSTTKDSEEVSPGNEVPKTVSILKLNILPKLKEVKQNESTTIIIDDIAEEIMSKVSTVPSSEITVEKPCFTSPDISPPVLEKEEMSEDLAPPKVNKARKTHGVVVISSNDEKTPEKSKHPSSSDSKNRSSKSRKRKHFKGSTYKLYLSSPKKKKKRPLTNPDGSLIKYDETLGTETTGSTLDSADEDSYRSDFLTSSEKSYQEDDNPRSSSESNSKTSPGNNSNRSFTDMDKFPIPTSRIKKELAVEEHEPQLPAIMKIKEEVMDVSSGTEVETEVEFEGGARRNNYSKEESLLLPTGEAAVPDSVTSNSNLVSSLKQTTLVRHTRANKSSGVNANRDGSSIALSVKSRQRIKRRTIDENEVSYASDYNNSETPKRAKRDQSHRVHAALSNTHANGTNPKFEVLYDNSLAPVVVCTCQTKPLDATSESANSKIYCQAIDSIDDKLIGCCNEVSTHHLVRPSVKISFTAMCEVHLWRLKHHQCCPVCGIFCSQGDFMQCSNENGGIHRIHLFHEDCRIVLKNMEGALCPHCGHGGRMKTVTLELNTPSASTFYLTQKPMFSEPRAKMTFTRLEVKEDVDEFPSRSFQVPETGKVFSSAGLPVGADRTQLEAMLVALDTEKLAFLNYTDEQLYLAAQNGEVENVLYMLALGFNPNKKYLDYGGNSALHGAALNGHLVTVHLLLQAGASIDQTNTRLYTPLMECIEKKQLIIVQYLVKSGAQLLAKGDDGMSSLHLAARCGSLEICKVLLNTGKIMANIQDDGGWTPIVWAAEHSHLEIVKLLIERGADTTLRDNEENIALHWSAFSGNVDISQIFMDLGCKLSNVNEHGDTPLHIAARQNNYECVVLFLARGADVDAINKENETPMKCCIDPNSSTYMALMMNSALKKLTQNRPHKAEKVMHKDISRGKEPNCIQCVNGIDEEEAPADFLYIIKNCETSAINIDRTITSLQSCQCDDDCTSSKCTCATISFKCWYDNEGKLLPEFNMPDPPMIFECNQACICWKNCNNRVLQHGILSRLQLFRTVGKGWGVRTLKDIPRGTFICEYIGEIISDSEADQREDDSYLFDLDNRDGETYCLDARYYGNISRFINHLCEPNLVPVKVFVEHQDLSFPRIAFFSSRDIKAGEELGFDYGEKFWVIKYKCFTCACNSTGCKYSKDTIHQTLESYYKRLKEEHPEEEIAVTTSVLM